jgi:MoaD family protein
VIALFIPPSLRRWSEGRERVEVAGATVREALASLFTAHPGLRDRVINEAGALRPHVNVFVGGESIRFSDGLETAVRDGDELHILPAVSGGATTDF